MKKKVLALIMSAALVVLVGCGNAAKSDVEQAQDIAEQEIQQGEEEEAPEETTTTEEEPEDEAEFYYTSDEMLNDGKDVAPDLDITGCDTFTQIVDQKLEPGMGYANVKIGDTDVLLVASACYDGGRGEMWAIDSTIYMYTDDGSIAEVGKVTCGGTAYPLYVKDDILYCGANHWLVKDTIKDGKLVMVEEVWVDYQQDGSATYYYASNGSEPIVCEDDSDFNSLFTEYEDATVVEFSVVGDV